MRNVYHFLKKSLDVFLDLLFMNVNNMIGIKQPSATPPPHSVTDEKAEPWRGRVKVGC